MTEQLFPYRPKIIPAEQMIATLDGIIQKYHEVLVDNDMSPEMKEQVHALAVLHIEMLGFTRADAERWLKPGNKRYRR